MTNTKDEAGDESLEESIFKTLSNQRRRDILRVIGEKKEMTFTEIKNQVEIEDSPTLSYHLNALGQLLSQKEGKYRLSELGNDTYNLMCKIATYSTTASVLSSLRKVLPAVVIVNSFLWAGALLTVFTFEGRPHLITIATIAVLWFISDTVLYTISQRVKTKKPNIRRILFASLLPDYRS